MFGLFMIIVVTLLVFIGFHNENFEIIIGGLLFGIVMTMLLDILLKSKERK